MIEKNTGNTDSIEIRIRYKTQLFENDIRTKEEPVALPMITLTVNKSKNYFNLVRAPVRRVCSFSPKVKNQYIIDSSNTVRLAKQKIEKIGIYTYGLDRPVEIVTANPSSNYFEIMIVQPIDKERSSRGKKVIIKGNRAFFYEHKGKTVNWLEPLKRRS